MQALQTNSLLQGGRYKILSSLGQGGFGITYLAMQSGLERKVAVKEFFMKELCERDESTSHVTLGTTDGTRETVARFREKFLKEARNIAKLNHPNIVRIIDVFEENGTAYYVMEYAENGSLAEKVKHEGYLSEPVATRYILQVASALEYIHQQKMNHLDVKPANIMLNEKDESVLIDFGLSKQYDATTGNQTSTTPVGISEGYAPMEQYKQGGVGAFSPETDIYALGATFFKLLTGITPPSASDVNEDGVPVSELKIHGVSQKTIDVICKAMEGRKKDRMKDVRIFIDWLKNDKTTEPIVEDDEATVLTAESQKKENERRRKEAEAKAAKEKAEAEARAKVEAERKAREEAERKKQEAEKAARKAAEAAERKKKMTWIAIAAVVIIAAIIGVIQMGGNSADATADANQEVTAGEKVQNKTIVLTKGHESKRNFVYSGEVDADGLPHGQGEAQYPETKSSGSCTFKGTFEHGITSNGEMTFSNGTKYKGTFTAEGFFKEGTWTEKDGYYFKGSFKNGDPYNGTWYTPQGDEDSKVVNGQ